MVGVDLELGLVNYSQASLLKNFREGKESQQEYTVKIPQYEMIRNILTVTPKLY